MAMKGSATAFGRLEFIGGPFRLQLLHMKMKKVAQDYSSCMRLEINFDDILSVAWLASLTRGKVSNKSKDIKKNDSSFELHDQFIAAVQAGYLVKMYGNFIRIYPTKLDDINSLNDVVRFILDMLSYFKKKLYFDPESEAEEDIDDLYAYCQVSVVIEAWLVSSLKNIMFVTGKKLWFIKSQL